MDRVAGRVRGWLVVLCYAAVAGASQLLWLTFAPVTTAAAHHYGVSVGAIGWLANVFPLLYVVLGLPAGLVLDRWPTAALAAGAAVTALGGVVRLVGDDFGWALAGQLLVALAQPFVLTAVTGVVAVLPATARPTGIAVGSAGLFLGLVAALATGALAGGDQLHDLLLWQAVAGVLAAVALLVVLRPGADRTGSAPPQPGRLRIVWSDPVLRRVAVLGFSGFGVFIALTTWLQPLLEPAGISESAAGWIITGAVATGVVTSTVVAGTFEGRPVLVVLLRSLLVAAVAGLVVLAVAHRTVSATFGAVLTTAALLTALPWLLAVCERRGGTAVASATALLWLAGNLGGLVVAVSVGALVDHPTPAFLLMATTALAGLPLVRSAAFRG